MSFLDEDEPPAGGPPEPPRRQRREPPEERQQILLRRLIAVGAGILVLILLVLGVRGCLNARKERATRDYATNVGELVRESNKISREFFGRLDNPKTASPLDIENEIKADRSAADALLSRVRNLDPPGELDDAQSDLVITFEARRDGLGSIADQIQTALGREGRREATEKIASDMLAFAASDYFYTDRVIPKLSKSLQEAGIEGVEIQQSQFLPDFDWLQTSRVQEALGKVSGAEQAATPGLHGLGLVQVLASPGDVVLNQGAPTTVRGGSRPELQVQIQNQGDTDEADVNVNVKITGGGGKPIELTKAVKRIPAGQNATVAIPISPVPPKGRELTVEVEAEPVPGEQVEDNNKASYTVTYE